MATTRAKFRCNSVQAYASGTRTYALTAVVDDGTPENERYHRYTPAGTLQISVDNPAVVLDLGADYYLDITPAEQS
jgi:hypothetical protein